LLAILGAMLWVAVPACSDDAETAETSLDAEASRPDLRPSEDPDAPSPDAPSPDAPSPDAPSRDAETSDADEPDGPYVVGDLPAPDLDRRDLPGMTGGETCADAPTLASVSTGPAPGSTWRTLQGSFGASDDYNPLDTSGLEPGCSLVYDAYGPEVVYTVLLSPGETLAVRYTVDPARVPGGLYLLDGCDVVGWPDLDGSTACGDNEYAANGFCGVGCSPIEWEFTWPIALDGAATVPTTFYLVLDTVADATARGFELEWRLH